MTTVPRCGSTAARDEERGGGSGGEMLTGDGTGRRQTAATDVQTTAAERRHWLLASFALPRSRADVVGDDSDCESVAESCPCPYQPASVAATGGGLRGGACCDEGMEEENDDDGYSSCVEGDGCYELRLQGDGGEEEEASSEGGVWWTKLAAAAAAHGSVAARDRELLQRQREEEEDPRSAAARQEEDRKFWEDCLASGYP
ncbi:hypothetical protein E2562_015891 [Oryza meyeriana var. granulata]|uniref:Uncharacterized protein n=1 Tax=Oryza meyeriana var. granulata TaxID=110450 RepID=A0A6G1D4Q3_9ORYZ|nr:hypothetical protein E2562_015891 [Oryza meyeriana var. granulata]